MDSNCTCIYTRQEEPFPNRVTYEFGRSLLARGEKEAELIFVHRRFQRTLCHAYHYLFFSDGWIINKRYWDESTFYIQPRRALREMRSRQSDSRLRYLERARYRPKLHEMVLEDRTRDVWLPVRDSLTHAAPPWPDTGFDFGRIAPDVLSRLVAACDTQEFFGIPPKETAHERRCRGKE